MNNELTAALATIEKCREITNCPAGVDLQDHLRQLVSELSVVEEIHNNAVFITDELYDASPKEVQNIIRSLACMKMPAYARLVAGIKAEALPANIAEIIDSGDLETICWQHEHYKAEDYRLALYRFRTDREGVKK